MTIRDLERQFAYDAWANARLFEVLGQLTPDQFVQPVAGSYGSVRNTLVHVMSAEWGWIERCGGTARGPALKADDYPTVSSLIDRWQQVEGYVRDFLAAQRDSDLDRTVQYALGDGPTHTLHVGDLLQHALTHSVHHRGQVSLLLRLLGHVPGNYDVLIYAMQRGMVQREET